ncbi:MAG: alpha/beta hydrolase [Acidimicrobiales bacterium]|nr:alpha/beta hydrolase [Acidimicrobiales bacterium]MCB1262452.1 alpha/beta hydrolase [Acidimicrobiales bacterium]
MQRTYDDDGFEFARLIALGSTYRGLADIGEVLTTIERIPDGDRETWVREWTATADRLADAAQASADAGHDVSARTAWLRAALYYDHASSMAPGTSDPGAYHRLWERQRDCWDAAAARFDPPIEHVAIPYEDMTIEGYVLKPDASDEPRPWVVLNNGSDGPVVSMLAQGGQAALDRGWNALTFDGPGQGATFHRQGVGFRPDWEAVITPVLDWLLARPDVDPTKVVLHGISQAGYWVPRAAAYEHRLAAIVADPGVVDVGASWTSHLPQMMIDLFDQGDKDDFDAFMGAADADVRAMLQWRMAPYLTTSYYDAYQAASAQHLTTDEIAQITCPTLILDPDDEQFWPGQSQQLYDALTCEKRLVHFSRDEGANWHCEVAAQGRRDEVVYDWLADVLGA